MWRMHGTSGNDGAPSNHWIKGEDYVKGDGELGRYRYVASCV